MELSRFPLTSEESELLMLFDEFQDIKIISQKMTRDPSGVSRGLKKLAEKFPVIEKRAGRWQMTPLGAELNALNRNFIQAQNSLLRSQSRLRIGTNREFASRVVAPRLADLDGVLRGVRIDLLSFEGGVEQALKSGAIDIGFDCGRPADPLVSYKMLIKEPIAPYCSKKFFKEHKRDIEAKNWAALPHILCERLYPDRIMNLSERSWQVASHVNDIASARELAKAHKGWALLPNYSVSREVEEGDLVNIGLEQYEVEKYGIWWLRERKFLQSTVETLSGWMKDLTL
ncbi:LysR substrate-binding domain-containing protein [Bdellovibrio sp. HCB337]|uniref:LysR substrate-binding domain-containing protein n=1 Tax=Bdellovibrio sp. HCB337 TaxID=3394358 RepID=UPI0039A61F57